MNSNSLLFAFGAITFLVTFSWFKYAAMEVFKKELESAEEDQEVWTKLFKVFLVDWLVCVAGVLGTGILFVTVFNMAH
jgi:flagellar biosynthesis protein FlhB